MCRRLPGTCSASWSAGSAWPVNFPMIGFIQNKGQGYTCCGCWKSYGDPHMARRRFSRYHRCTALYKQRYASGTPITQLIVAA